MIGLQFQLWHSQHVRPENLGSARYYDTRYCMRVEGITKVCVTGGLHHPLSHPHRDLSFLCLSKERPQAYRHVLLRVRDPVEHALLYCACIQSKKILSSGNRRTMVTRFGLVMGM